jgi:hypothetical protein
MSKRFPACTCMNRSTMSRLVQVALALFVCFTASAATLQQLSVDQMSQSATTVVRARVTGSYTSSIGSTIYTHYKLQISELWKGASATEVLLPGGVLNGARQSFPGIPELGIGSEYVLFLWKSPSTGITHLLGLTQGLFNVSQQSDGTVLASRPKIGEMMLDAAGHKVADQAVSMNLADMKSRVRQPQTAGVL